MYKYKGTPGVASARPVSPCDIYVVAGCSVCLPHSLGSDYHGRRTVYVIILTFGGSIRDERLQLTWS